MNTLAFLSNVFSGDGLLILLAILILFGAKRIPELARGLGQAINEFNKAKDDVQQQITSAAEPVQPVTPPAQSTPSQEPPKPATPDHPTQG